MIRKLLLNGTLTVALTLFSNLYSQYDLDVVAISGQEAPGTSGGVFDHFQSSNQIWLDQSGKIIFGATLRFDVGGITFNDDNGLWIVENSEVKLMAREDGAIPGLPGLQFDDGFGQDLFPLMDPDGNVGVLTKLIDGDENQFNNSAVLIRAGDDFAVRFRSGGPAGLEGSILGELSPSFTAFNGGRAVFMTNAIHNEFGNFGRGIWVASQGEQLTNVAFDATFNIFGFPMESFSAFTLSSFAINLGAELRPVINPSGKVAYVAQGTRLVEGVNSKAAVVYRWDPESGTSTPILSEVWSPTFNEQPNIEVDKLTINAVGQVAFFGKTPTSGEQEGIWVQNDGAFRLALGIGSIADGASGATFAHVVGYVLLDNGNIAVLAETSDALQGIWIEYKDDGLRKVARTGDPAVGTGEGTTFNMINSIGNLVANNSGDVAFASGLTGPDVTFENQNGIWVGNPDGLTQVIRIGDTVEIGPGDSSTALFLNMRNSGYGNIANSSFVEGTGADGLGTYFNDNGDLIFEVVLTSEPDYVLLLARPCSKSLSEGRFSFF